MGEYETVGELERLPPHPEDDVGREWRMVCPLYTGGKLYLRTSSGTGF